MTHYVDNHNDIRTLTDFGDGHVRDAVIVALQEVMHLGHNPGQSALPRVRIHYGDPVTGEDDLSEDAEGYVTRTAGNCGPVKRYQVPHDGCTARHSPMLITNSNASGGRLIICDRIVRVRFANRKRGGDLYRHPLYHVDAARLRLAIPDPVARERVWERVFAYEPSPPDALERLRAEHAAELLAVHKATA